MSATLGAETESWGGGVMRESTHINTIPVILPAFLEAVVSKLPLEVTNCFINEASQTYKPG